MKIDKKSGVDLDELRKQLKVYGDVGPEGRRKTKDLMFRLWDAYPYEDRQNRPPEIKAIFEEFRRLTHFTSYIEDVIIIRQTRLEQGKGGLKWRPKE